MANRLTPLGILIKWFVVPISLGAVGYFLVGPRVEVPKEMQDKVRAVAGGANTTGTPSVDEPEEETKPTRTFAEPQVDVSVTAMNTRPKKPKRKRRRRKPPTETPASSNPAPEAPISVGPSDAPSPSDGT